MIITKEIETKINQLIQDNAMRNLFDEADLFELRRFYQSITDLYKNPFFEGIEYSKLNMIGRAVYLLMKDNTITRISPNKIEKMRFNFRKYLKHLYYDYLKDVTLDSLDIDNAFQILGRAQTVLVYFIFECIEYQTELVWNPEIDEEVNRMVEHLQEVFEGEAEAEDTLQLLHRRVNRNIRPWNHRIDKLNIHCDEEQYNTMLYRNICEMSAKKANILVKRELEKAMTEFEETGDIEDMKYEIKDILNTYHYRMSCEYNLFEMYIQAAMENKSLTEVMYPPQLYFGSEIPQKAIAPNCIPSKISKIEVAEHTEKVEVGAKHNIEVMNGFLQPNAYHVTELREGIGFDKCTFECHINSIDIDKLIHMIELGVPEGQEMTKRPWIRCESNNKIASYVFEGIKGVPDEFIEDTRYSEVYIQITPFEKLRITQNNVSRQGGEKQPNLVRLEMHVIPQNVLGNINNYTVDEMRTRVKGVVEVLREEFGIYIDYKKITIAEVEINNTFAFEYTLNELRRSIGYFQFYNRYVKALDYKGSKDSDVSEIRSRAKMTAKEAEIKDRSRFNATWETLGAATKDLRIIIEIYDKGKEIQDAFRDKVKSRDRLDVLPPYADGRGKIIRLEFKLKGNKAINNHFRKIYDKEDVRHKKGYEYTLYDITQEDLIEIYRGLVDDYFGISYENYAKQAENMVTALLDKINTKNKNWGINFLKAVYGQEINCGTTPMLLSVESIDELLGYSKFGRNNYSENKEKFHRLLEDSEDYPIGKDNAYDILIQFIHKAKMISGICEEREIRYFVGEKIKNDDMEEEESMEEMNVGH